MRDTSTFTLQDHQRIASAFLALTDDLSPEAVQRSLIKVVSAPVPMLQAPTQSDAAAARLADTTSPTKT